MPLDTTCDGKPGGSIIPELLDRYAGGELSCATHVGTELVEIVSSDMIVTGAVNGDGELLATLS